MSAPTAWQRFRQTMGRAVRESGQALDRLGVKTAAVATTKHDYYDDPVVYEDHLSRHRQQFPLLWAGQPVVHPAVAYLAPCATLVGSVRIGKGSSVWYGAVLRADECLNAGSYSNSNNKDTEDAIAIEEGEEALEEGDGEPWELSEDRFRDRIDHHGGGIFVGDDTNLQDNCTVTAREAHCRIGSGVTVGHLAQIHSATVGDYCLVGMGAVVSEGAVIGTEAFVAAGAVVGRGQVVRSGELWLGNPAQKVRDLSAEERQRLHYQSSEYVKVARLHEGVMELGGNVSKEMLEEARAARLIEEGEEQQQQQVQSDEVLDEPILKVGSR